MKNRIFLLLPLLLLTGCSTNSDPDVKSIDPNIHYDNVYIIMGQSNASGISPFSFLETKDPEMYAKYQVEDQNVLISYDKDGTVDKTFHGVKYGFGGGNNGQFFGPEIGIADSISSTETQYILKATWSGSTLQTQYMDKDGNKKDLYNRYIAFLNEQLSSIKESGKNPRVRGIFWMQGESDSSNQLCHTYKQATSFFVSNLRQDLNSYIYGYVNFVDAYISTRSPHWPNPSVINQAKQEFADENEHNYCIKTNGEDDGALNLVLKHESGEDPNDKAHYDSVSMLALGREAAKYLIK